MTDPVPSKERSLDERLRFPSSECEVLRAADEAADEIERLRTALTGISTCSTCEACRGAALRALGERSVAEIAAAVDERLDRVERELAYPYQQNPIGSASISTQPPEGEQ
jgi:hypothetical protein